MFYNLIFFLLKSSICRYFVHTKKQHNLFYTLRDN